MKKYTSAIGKTALLVSLMVAVTACGKPAASQPTEVSSAPVSSTVLPASSAQSEQSADDPWNVTDKTYQCFATGAKYYIDLVKTSGKDSGEGRLENREGYALGVGNCNQLSEAAFGTQLDQCKTVTDIPEQIKNNLILLMGAIRYNGAELQGYMDAAITITGTEDAGEENGYELCRFTGEYTAKDMLGVEVKLQFVGYATFLKQSGYPIYTLAVDVTEDQSNGDMLDAVAHDSIVTLRENNEE